MKMSWIVAPILSVAVVIGLPATVEAQDAGWNGHGDGWGQGFGDHDGHGHGEFRFQPGTLVLSKTVYVGKASTVTIGEALPIGCQGGATGLTVQVPLVKGGTTGVAVPCGVASDNGEFPNLWDSHNVWNNVNTDPTFGVTSPVFLDEITPDGFVVGTLPIPDDQIVTSFSSKSELALNRSVDGKSLTFMAYRGGVGCGGTTVSPTRPNLLDVSNGNTPGVCDPTNPVFSSDVNNPSVPTAYYRAVAEVTEDGKITYTDGNAYSGDNGRGAIKGGTLVRARFAWAAMLGEPGASPRTACNAARDEIAAG